MLNELGRALAVTAQVLVQRRFWSAMGRGLLSPPLLVVITVTLTLNLFVDVRQIAALGIHGGGIGVLVAGSAGMLLLFPLLMRAWCPEVARAVLRVKQLDVPELALPSIARFIGAWLVVVVIGVLLVVPAVFLPPPYSWGLLLPAALLFSGYQVRCALCIHADSNESQAVVAATMMRRTLLWWPLCTIPLYVANEAKTVLKGLFDSPFDLVASPASRAIDLIGMAGGLAAVAVALVMWAALSLHALEERTGGRWPRVPEKSGSTPGPAATPSAPVSPAPAGQRRRRAPSARAWLLAVLVVIVAGSAYAYSERLVLLHHYLAWTDAQYKTDIRYSPDGLPIEPFLASVMQRSACANRLPRIRTMFKAGYKPDEFTLGYALACAAKHDNLEFVRFMLDQGADVNSMPGNYELGSRTPLTALQHAVANRSGAMLELLLSKGADAALRSHWNYGEPGPSALHFAALNRDAEMIGTLIKAGAKPDAAGPETPIYWFMEATALQGKHAAADWEAALAVAERAGLSVDAGDFYGGTLLHWAASQGQLELIEVLLARGMDPKKQEKEGAYPFMRLAAWYRYSTVEPGPALESTFTALTAGLHDINPSASFTQQFTDKRWGKEIQWTIASAAAVKPRLRALFGDRIDYSMLGVRDRGSDWPLEDREQAEQLIAYFSTRPSAAPTLPAALRAKRWNDLAVLAEGKR